MSRIFAALCFAVLAFVAPAGRAQDSSAVVGQFRAYRDALARGDLAAAETAAAAAAAASQQIDGDGGRTPALLLNLARVRIQLGKWQEARDPAKGAFERARSGGVGVDPLMSEILWTRVRLELEGFNAAQNLQDVLDRASSREDLLGDRYDAADQLGLWAREHKSHIIARRAWASAAQAARGAAIDANFARGRALAQEGVAILMQSLSRDPVIAPTVARQARERLAEAHGLVRPFAFVPLADGSLATPHALYAQILAWDGALWSKVSVDEARTGLARLDPNPSVIDGTPVCEVANREGPAPAMPTRQLFEGQLGAVVLRLSFDAQGVYEGAVVAAAVGDEAFIRAVTTAASSWVYTLDMSAGCKPPAVLYQPVVFTFRI